MPRPGTIVILNGAPRAGKSSIATALQAEADRPWLNLGVDIAMAMTPARYRPGIGLRPGGERPDLEPLVKALYSALFDSIAAHSRLGLDIIADLGIHESYSVPLGIWGDMAHRLAGLPVLRVGVTCPIETIMARRNADPQNSYYAAGEGVPAPVERWQHAVHDGKVYDLVVDTSAADPAACAGAIRAALATRYP